MTVLDQDKPAHEARSSQRAVALTDFMVLRTHIHALACALAKIPNIPEHYRAQANAIVGLAGLKLHNVIGEGDDADALAICDDIEALPKIVDPLLQATGEHANENFHGVDMSLFTDQLCGAVDGNATFNMTEIADNIRESRPFTLADHEIALRRGK